MVNPSLWRNEYKSLKTYYQHKYSETFTPPNTLKKIPFYTLSEAEYEIDPDETVDDFNEYDAARQEEEIVKCIHSFEYFSHKYLRIAHPKEGLMPFVLFDYQRRVVEDYDNHRFNIISKFRQGGLTTVTTLWLLWRCMFRKDEQMMVVSKTDREAIAAGEIVTRAIQNLPDFLKPQLGKANDHHKQFLDTGCNLFFASPEAARGRALTYLVIDEAAFIDGMEDHWKSLFPTINTGGNCIVVSTVNGMGNWYEQYYHGACKGTNKFHKIDLDYWEHPQYYDEEWVAETKAQLGEKGWAQEVLRDFLKSGNTYFDTEHIVRFKEATTNNYPIQVKFEKYANPKEDFLEEIEPGALWIWEEQKAGAEYIFGVDCADGVGERGDNSVIQVIEIATLTQVAEFYSNSIDTNTFAKFIGELGSYYNNALIVLDNMGAPGGAVANALKFSVQYENLYYHDETKKNPKPGLPSNKDFRKEFIAAMELHLQDHSLIINSPRVPFELNTFLYNAVKQRPEASKGSHDDAIMALAIALYVIDNMDRDLPAGMPASKAEDTITQMFTKQITEQIRKEIMENTNFHEIEEEEDNDILSTISAEDMQLFKMFRKGEKVLREFNW